MDLFSYTDYRVYLRDWINEQRRKRGFSLRVFKARAGLGSQGHFKMVVDGKRNLGESGLERFMNGMRLMGEERLFFRNLVLWNQAEDDEKRARYEGKLNLLRKCRPHMTQIRERIDRFRGEISEFLSASFTPEEASQLARQILATEGSST